jgi:hypothetical protein
MRSGLLAAVVTLQCAALWAGEAVEASRHNAAATTQAGIPWMSGGIGYSARDAMRKAAQQYNVHLVFSARNGGYLAAIPVTVTRHDGQQVYAGISAGPLLYLQLPPGSYRVSAAVLNSNSAPTRSGYLQ